MFRSRFFPIILLMLTSLIAGCGSRSGVEAGLSLSLEPTRPFTTNNAAWVLLADAKATWQESPDRPRQPLKPGLFLASGTVIESGRDGDVRLALPGSAGTMTLEPDTRVILTRTGGEGLFGAFVTQGRVAGDLTAGSLELSSSCGGALMLTPQPGMTAPYSFGNTVPREIWDAIIGLTFNPDLILPPLPSELELGKTPTPFVGPYSVPSVPEPGLVALGSLGILVLVGYHRRGHSR